MPPMRPCLASATSSSCVTPLLPLSLSPSAFPFSATQPGLRARRLHSFRPLSSLRETKKQSVQKVSNVPRGFNFEGPGKRKEEDGVLSEGEGKLGGDAAVKGSVLAGLLLVGVVGGFGTVGYIYRDQINAFLTQFSGFIEGYGPAGYALFVAVYAGLEILAIPAIPLTMSAGLLFGSFTGTIIVSISGTIAAAVAFLIASWLGMLPGTWAYVSAGAFGRAIIQEESEIGLNGGNGQLLTLGLGLLATALAASYVTRLAKDAVKDIE